MSTDPLDLAVRPSQRKKMRQRAKEQQGYDPKPPKCQSCKHFSPPISKGFYQVPYCTVGRFAASPDGVCGIWEGLDGSQLEPEST